MDPAFSVLWEDFHELFPIFLKTHDLVPWSIVLILSPFLQCTGKQIYCWDSYYQKKPKEAAGSAYFNYCCQYIMGKLKQSKHA